MNGRRKLRRYLRARGLTQEAFAQSAQVPAPQVSLWLSGKRTPGLASALKIAAATRGEINAADWVGLGVGGRAGSPNQDS